MRFCSVLVSRTADTAKAFDLEFGVDEITYLEELHLSHALAGIMHKISRNAQRKKCKICHCDPVGCML